MIGRQVRQHQAGLGCVQSDSDWERLVSKQLPSVTIFNFS